MIFDKTPGLVGIFIVHKVFLKNFWQSQNEKRYNQASGSQDKRWEKFKNDRPEEIKVFKDIWSKRESRPETGKFKNGKPDKPP